MRAEQRASALAGDFELNLRDKLVSLGRMVLRNRSGGSSNFSKSHADAHVLRGEVERPQNVDAPFDGAVTSQRSRGTMRDAMRSPAHRCASEAETELAPPAGTTLRKSATLTRLTRIREPSERDTNPRVVRQLHKSHTLPSLRLAPAPLEPLGVADFQHVASGANMSNGANMSGANTPLVLRPYVMPPVLRPFPTWQLDTDPVVRREKRGSDQLPWREAGPPNHHDVVRTDKIRVEHRQDQTENAPRRVPGLRPLPAPVKSILQKGDSYTVKSNPLRGEERESRPLAARSGEESRHLATACESLATACESPAARPRTRARTPMVPRPASRAPPTPGTPWAPEATSRPSGGHAGGDAHPWSRGDTHGHAGGDAPEQFLRMGQRDEGRETKGGETPEQWLQRHPEAGSSCGHDAACEGHGEMAQQHGEDVSARSVALQDESRLITMSGGSQPSHLVADVE